MTKSIRLHAADISCHHCAMTIERELANVPGIVSVKVDVPSKTIELQYESDSALENARAVLADIGYPVAA